MAGTPPSGAVFSIRIKYRGQERSSDLPLGEEMISQLAREAEIRGMRIGELLAALLLEIVEKLETTSLSQLPHIKTPDLAP